jgi:hypothetical protein
MLTEEQAELIDELLQALMPGRHHVGDRHRYRVVIRAALEWKATDKLNVPFAHDSHLAIEALMRLIEKPDDVDAYTCVANLVDKDFAQHALLMIKGDPTK